MNINHNLNLVVLVGGVVMAIIAIATLLYLARTTISPSIRMMYKFTNSNLRGIHTLNLRDVELYTTPIANYVKIDEL